jgi:hypothetical protein
VLALCFILIGAARIVSTYRQLSITTDEPYHLTSGLEYLTTHRHTETEQPPLAQAAVALLPFFQGARIDAQLGIRPLFTQRPDKAWRTMVAMRAGVLPFFVIAALVVFFGARRLFGPSAAVISTALFTLLPPVLAHGSLATNDMAATAMLSAAFLVLIWWAESPSPRRAAFLGVAIGLATLTKFSLLVYLPASAGLALLVTVATRRPRVATLEREVTERIPTLLLAGGIAAVTVWAGYLFAVGPIPESRNPILVPAPDLWQGLHVLAVHNVVGHGAFLLGEYRTTGWWYYFPVALAVKTPLALLVLAAIGTWASWRRRSTGGLLPVAFCLGILLPAMTSHINIGVRHVLPIYVGLSILGGLGTVQLASWLRGAGVFAVLAPLLIISWMALSSARAHPDYLAYFNEFGGSRPDRILVDSDLDWRQDHLLLARRLRELGAHAVWLDLDPQGFPNADIFESLYNMPPIQPVEAIPRPGFHVVGLTALRKTHSSGHLPWYERLQPLERVGGLLLFRIPDGSFDQSSPNSSQIP